MLNYQKGLTMKSRTMRMVRTGVPAALLLAGQQVFAGGGGQNMLLVVNPTDENSLRVANAYAKMRAIPDNNIVFLTNGQYNPGLIDFTGQVELNTSAANAMNTYIKPTADAIVGRNLTSQIDYIGTLGMAQAYSAKAYYGADGGNSLTYGLSLATPLTNGGLTFDQDNYSYSQLYQNGYWYTAGNNTAIHHSTVLHAPFSSAAYNTPYNSSEHIVVPTQYYMAGDIGYSGQMGNGANQIIANLQRSVNADGSKPQGTVYFEDSGDIYRSTAGRKNDWNSYGKPALTARGIATVTESGMVPTNRTDVLGVVAGAANLPLPNGGTYLAGSFADNLTSAGGAFLDRGQTKSTQFLASGAAASYGAVVEPYNDSNRFASSMIHTYLADGSTMAEAYAKSVMVPDMQVFLGDMLSQPSADVPKVNFTAGPANNATVSGSVAISAAGSITGGKFASDVAKLQLWIDGKQVIGVADVGGNNGTFSLDTTKLSDGKHEVRVVAINNAAAESQGYVLQSINVNNQGRSIVPGTTRMSLSESQVQPINVSASLGSGTLSRIELRSLGRNLGQITTPSGNISVEATKLAYGENRLVPVAIFSDGSEVAGDAITVTRNPTIMAGRTPTSAANGVAGIKTEYFVGKGASSVTGSDFTGIADVVATHTMANLNSSPTNPSFLRSSGGIFEYLSTDGISNFDKLAVRLSGTFNVAPANAGEYQFFFWHTNDNAKLYVDGKEAAGWGDVGAGNGMTNTTAPSVFLDPGEHDLQILATNINDGANNNMFDISATYRGPDGKLHLIDNSLLYQSVPEPSALGLVILGTVGLLRRWRKSHA